MCEKMKINGHNNTTMQFLAIDFWKNSAVRGLFALYLRRFVAI